MNITGALTGLLGGPYAFILGRLLDSSTDWKKVALEQGADAVNDQLRKAWRAKVTIADLAAIAATMEGEGWTWAAASDPAFRAKQKVQIQAQEEALGPGFIICRDAVYAILRETGLPGGATRDGIRDAIDQGVWAEVAAKGINETSTLEQIVAATFEAVTERVL